MSRGFAALTVLYLAFLLPGLALQTASAAEAGRAAKEAYAVDDRATQTPESTGILRLQSARAPQAAGRSSDGLVSTGRQGSVTAPISLTAPPNAESPGPRGTPEDSRPRVDSVAEDGPRGILAHWLASTFFDPAMVALFIGALLTLRWGASRFP